MRSWRFSLGPIRIETASVGDVDVEPSVVVVVEESESASFGLDDGTLMIYAAPHVWNVQSSLLSYVHKLHAGWGGIRFCGFDGDWISPVPEGSCKCIRQRTAKHEKR